MAPSTTGCAILSGAIAPAAAAGRLDLHGHHRSRRASSRRPCRSPALRASGTRSAAKALEAAKALSFGFDQEVAAVNYLLKGLSKSPALLSGDTKAFYDQLKATPVPEGSWLVLNDLERQVANTLRPFGSPLPRHVGLPELPGAARPDPGSAVDRLRPGAGAL